MNLFLLRQGILEFDCLTTVLLSMNPNTIFYLMLIALYLRIKVLHNLRPTTFVAYLSRRAGCTSSVDRSLLLKVKKCIQKLGYESCKSIGELQFKCGAFLSAQTKS